ncbi:MAG TPA: TetR/AcrR family transcriptional regulator [Terrimicrobiaceae bacterium]
MPKISAEKRTERRGQILNAAWRCFQREGLHVTTMNDIIGASGLSAGAVYSYFENKEDLILAALTTSLSELRERLGSVLQGDAARPPEMLLVEMLDRIVSFSAREGFDLKNIALLGWSEAQRNPRLRETMSAFYVAFRNQLSETAKAWQRAGLIAPTAAPDDVAKTLLALIMGFVAQSVIIGEIDPPTINRGLQALRQRQGGSFESATTPA